MIFCGKQAIDGDTAQVGPEIAEHMGIAQVTCAVSAELEDDLLRVTKQTDEGVAVLSVQMPCVITYTKPQFTVRPPSLRRKFAANHAEIHKVVADDLPGLDRTHTGLKGSPTKVRKTRVATVKTRGTMIDEGTPEADANKLVELLAGAGAL